MEIFFSNSDFKIAGASFSGVPFFVNSEYRLLDEVNEFFTTNILIDGRINSKNTWKHYAYWLQDYIKWTLANNIDWKTVTTLEVTAYRNWSLEECNLTPSTVNSRISLIKRFYNYAIENDLAKSNPIQMLTSVYSKNVDSDMLNHTHRIKFQRNNLSIKTHQELPKIYSDDQVLELFKACESERLKLMMRLMLECGMRRSEVCLLSLKLIEEIIKTAQILGSKSEIILKLPKEICKGNKSRQVIVSYTTVMRLMQYKATIRPKLVKKFKLVNNAHSESFWLTRQGSSYKSESLSIEISKLGKKVGIDKATPHMFRHTFATNLYASTGNIRLVQKLLGHSHIQTTTIYEHSGATDRKGFLADYQNQLNELLN